MKDLRLSLLGSLSIWFISSCHTTKPVSVALTGSSEMLFTYQWNLAQLQGIPIIRNGDKIANLVFEQGQPNKVTGSAGCNRLSGTVELSGVNNMKLSPLATTKMACPGMNDEAAFLRVLSRVDNYSINNNQLLLQDGKTLLAKFFGVSKAGDTSALSGTWQLNYISGIRIAFEGLYPNTKPYISFNLSSNELGGNTTCNGFTSKFTMKGNTIHFEDPLKTMIFCEGGGEEAFLNMLKKVNKYAAGDSTLTFLTDDIAVMRFEKIK